MPRGEITGYVDVAQVVLYAFWIFFAGLVFYLRREDRREGYPLEIRGRPRPGDAARSDPDPVAEAVPPLQRPGEERAPDRRRAPPWNYRGHKHEVWPGAPLEPDTDGLHDAIGPAPTPTARTATTRPGTARSASCPCGSPTTSWSTNSGPNPIGMSVFGADRQVAGTVERPLGRPRRIDGPLLRGRARRRRPPGADARHLLPDRPVLAAR